MIVAQEQQSSLTVAVKRYSLIPADPMTGTPHSMLMDTLWKTARQKS